jgi:hypothetical protein
VKTAVLVCGVVVLGLVGGAAGYEAGLLTDGSAPSPAGVAAPLAGATPSAQPTRKTPEPNTTAPFTTTGLRFREAPFTVTGTNGQPTEMSIRVPRGWLPINPADRPQEVRFLDPLHERAVRVESNYPALMTTKEARLKLVRELQESQPFQNALTISYQGDDTVIGADGKPRTVSTVIYTYIPKKEVRYVAVRYVATGSDDQATVEMSITGLPQDAKGLSAVMAEASRSVDIKN